MTVLYVVLVVPSELENNAVINAAISP